MRENDSRNKLLSGMKTLPSNERNGAKSLLENIEKILFYMNTQLHVFHAIQSILSVLKVKSLTSSRLFASILKQLSICFREAYVS